MRLVRIVILSVGIAAACCQATRAAERLLAKGKADWKYLDTKEGATGNWASIAFDDSNWKTGAAPLGYGETDAKTQLAYGEDPQNKHLAAFFRHKFDVKNPKDFSSLLGRIRCDDGAVVYVNGQEVFRFNMPAGRVDSATTARHALGPNGPLEKLYYLFSIEPRLLQAGENVIAVRVHQSRGNSSDLLMDLELLGLTEKEEVEAKKLLDKQSQQLRQLLGP